MEQQIIHNQKIRIQTMRSLKYRYLLSVFIIFIALFIGQNYIKAMIHSNLDDAATINIAGRQRMLSQRISKDTFAIMTFTDTEALSSLIDEMKQAIADFEKSHALLVDGSEGNGTLAVNDPKLSAMYFEIQDEFELIITKARIFLALAQELKTSGRDSEISLNTELEQHLKVIKQAEVNFVNGMDQIVDYYQKQAGIRDEKVIASTFIIMMGIMLVILLNYLLILRPVMNSLKSSVQVLEATKEKMFYESELLKTTLNAVSVGVVAVDIDRKVIFENPIAEIITGIKNSDAIGRHYRELFYNADIQSGDEPYNPLEKIYKSDGAISSVRYTGAILQNNQEVQVEGIVQAIYDLEAKLSGSVITFRDVSKERALESEINAFLDIDLDMLCVINREWIIQKINGAFSDVVGYSSEELKDLSILEIIHEDDLKIAQNHLSKLSKNGDIAEFVSRVLTKTGEIKSIEWRFKLNKDNSIYSSARDVTIRMTQEALLKDFAIRDELTGLYNRHYFDTIISQEMERDDRYSEKLSMMILDLDHFKNVNDTWGHPIGDDVLKSIARILTINKRESDILLRFGGEEFILLMPLTVLQGAKIAAENIRLAVQESVHPIAGKITLSVGVAEHMKSESFRHWYKRSDDALYHAKQTGRNKVVASEDLYDDKSFIVQFAWQTEWESGYEFIDHQHKKLHELANILVGILYESDDTEKILSVLDSLIDYIAFHFASEERVLMDIQYKDYIPHVEAHKNLVAKVQRYRDEYIRGQIKEAAFLSFIIDDILIGHLVKMDTKFFEYLINAQVPIEIETSMDF